MASVAQVVVDLQGKDNASGPIGAVQKALGGLGSAVSGPIGAVGKLTAALGTIGLAAQGIAAVAGAASGLGGVLGVGLASNFEQVTGRMNAFTKDAGATAQILAQVRAEADKTPFAFNEMANAASMLLPASKSATGGLMGLVQQAEILAALNPAQGLEGAAFALREALSGDFVSVMERFNIPRELINRLKAEGVPNAEIVGRALKEMGADMDLVAGLAATTAGRFSTFQDALAGIQQKVGEPILAALGEQLDAMSGWLATNSEAVGAFATNLGDFLAEGVRVAAGAIGRLVEFLQPIGPIVATLAASALAAVHGDWANAMNGLEQAAVDALDFLDNSFGTAGSIVADLGRAALNAVRGDWAYAMDLVVKAGGTAVDWLTGQLTPVISAVQGAFADFAPTGEIIGRLFDTIGEAVAASLPHLAGAAENIAAAGEASDGAQGFLSATAEVVNAVAQAAEKAVGWLAGTQGGLQVMGAAAGIAAGLLTLLVVQTTLAGAAAFGTALGLAAMTAAQWLLNAALTANPIGIVVVAIGALIGMLVAAYNSNETFRNAVDTAWKVIKENVIPAVEAVITKIKEIDAFLRGYGPVVASAALSVGTAIVDGIKNGINAGLEWVKTAARNVAAAAVQAAKDLLNIGSPSKVFEEIGEQTVEGFVVGIDGEAAAAVAAVEELLASVRDTAEAQSAAAFANLGTILGAQFAKTYTLVEQAQMASLQKQEDAEGMHQRAQDKEQRAFDRKLADLREEAARATVKERVGVNERIAQLQEDHGRRMTDLAAGLEDKLYDLQLDGMDAVRAAEEKTALVRGEAMRDLARGLETLERETSSKSADIAQKAYDATQETIRKGAEDVQTELDKARDKIQDALDAQTLNRGIRGRRADFATGQDAAGQAFKQARDDADLLVKQAEQLADRRLRVEESAADVDRKREREDADAEYRLNQDLLDAKDDDARAALAVKFARTREDRDRTRRLDDDERDRKAKADATALEASFKKATADLAKRRAADVVAADFKKKQQADAQKFNDDLEDEALARNAVRTNADRDTRVAAITKAMNDKLAKIIETEQKEQDALRKSYTQKAQDLKEKFLDKVGPMTEEGMTALDGFIGGVLSRLEEVVGAASRAAEAVARVGQGGGPGATGGGGATWENQPQAVRDMFGGDRAKWEREHAAELGNAAQAGMPGPTGMDSIGGRPTGPGYYAPVPDTAYWRANIGRFDPLAWGDTYPEAAYGSSNSTSRDIFGGNNSDSTTGYEYAEGGMVPGPFGVARNAVVHGGEGIFTPGQLAAIRGGAAGQGIDYEALARAIASLSVVMNGQVVGRLQRSETRRFAAVNAGANGVGGALP